MAQPGADHVEIDTRLEEVHGRGVPPRMWRDLPGKERRAHFRGLSHTVCDDVPQAKTGEPVALGVDEEWDGRIEWHWAGGQIGLEGLDGFCPQRAGAFLAAFAEDPYPSGEVL